MRYRQLYPWRRSTRCKMPFFPSMPADASTKHVFTAHPEIYSHWAHVSEAILRGPSPLTPAQRELIGAYVSSLNSCQYCYGGHPRGGGIVRDRAANDRRPDPGSRDRSHRQQAAADSRFREDADADVDTHDASRCRRDLRGGVERGGLAFRYRGLLPVQFHEPARGRARDRG